MHLEPFHAIEEIKELKKILKLSAGGCATPLPTLYHLQC